jgi:hypothetical protein
MSTQDIYDESINAVRKHLSINELTCYSGGGL